MRLVAGSYDHKIWGYSVKPSNAENQALKFLFSYPSHTAPVKSLAAAGPVAASGGADDAVRLYDLCSSSIVGELLDQPGGSVGALALFAQHSFPRNLITGADDGAIRIYDADPFVFLKSVAVHRRAVADIAVHHSGRVALTVGRDCCFAMVNLIRGRRSFVCRLDREASIVKYASNSCSGERFYMTAEERITVHCSEDAKIISELDGKKRVLCIAPGENGLLFSGGEDRSITAWDTTSATVAYRIEDAHASRVKGLVVFKSSNDSQGLEASNFIVSASSDGIIKIWDARKISQEKAIPLSEANTKSRITCLAGSSIK